ncbi:kinase-like domain-containing protein, partial [Flammula alnicola]
QVYTHYPEVESINYYRPGVYHPVHIDDVFNERYRVVKKLGYGSYGTFWLVKDLVSGRPASLKVLVAEASNSSSEIVVLRHLKHTKMDGPDRQFVVLLDGFKIEGPNGMHQCIVTELLGPTLASDLSNIYYEKMAFPVDIANKMVTQIAQGVAYLYSCGVIHGG